MSTQTTPRPTVVVVSGNPREGSRTLGAARLTAAEIAAHVDGQVAEVIDLATFADEILTPDHPRADAARAALAGAAVAVVATPVHKASYTGLLKAFLDLYGADGLAGVVVVPLVVSGTPAHALVGEVHLRPVLVELGAVVPTRSLSVTEADLADLSPAIDAWLTRGGEALRRALGLASDAVASELAADQLAAVAR